MWRTGATPARAGSRTSAIWMRLVAAATGGSLLVLAYPDYGLWWLAFPGIMLVLAALRGASAGFGFTVGAISGAAFYLPHISWAQQFLGPIPWLALAGVMTVWWAGFGSLLALTYRNTACCRVGGLSLWPRLPAGTNDTKLGPVFGTSLAIGGVWTLREWLSSTVPYGGFAWGRVAQSQSNSPLLESLSWLGTSGLTFAIVTVCAFALETLHDDGQVRSRVQSGLDTMPRSLRLLPLSALAAAFALLACLPAWSTLTPQDDLGTRRILATQGDSPGASYFIPSRPGQIFLEHYDETRAAIARTEPDTIDLILWPEGSVDVSPWLNTDIASSLAALAREADAPVLMNTVTWDGPIDSRDVVLHNSQVLWTTTGAGEQYDKRRPVPFGEYVPNRELFEAIVPDLIGLIQREYIPGQRSNVLTVDDTNYGVFICFDIVDDALARAAVTGGAQLLLAPTNNADFGYTHEAAQQLAFARMRAVETGRAMVQVSTVGMSAAFAPDGSVVSELPWYTPGSMVVDLPLRTGATPAVLFGWWIEVAASALGVWFATRTRNKTVQ